jgi:multidrug efflux pump subunit AcrB
MECLKKFRPDLKETYVKYDYQDAIKQIKEEIRAKPWVVVLGVIIIILILVVSSID